VSIRKVISFGYKRGSPPPADNTWDVRDQLSNPWSKPELRNLTGNDGKVKRFVESDPSFPALVKAIIAAGGDTVAIGCMGGLHRSVALANRVAYLTGSEVSHRELKS